MKLKKYLEEEYLITKNLIPFYVCSFGRWYIIKNYLP